MASIRNSSQFIGNLTKDPEVRQVGENKVTSFSIAVNGYKKDAPPMYVDVDAWNGRGDAIAQHCQKGDKIAVQGEVSARAYLDREGEPQARLQIRLDVSEFLKLKKWEESRGEEEAPKRATAAKPTKVKPKAAEIEVDDEEDSLPF